MIIRIMKKIFLLIFVIAVGYFAFKAIPVRDFKKSDYLVVAKNSSNSIFSNKYPVESIPVRNKINKLVSLVGYVKDGIYASAWHADLQGFKPENFYLLKYKLSNGMLIITEIIDPYIPPLDFPNVILLIDPPYLYYFVENNKNLIKYNIKTHEREFLAKIDNCQYISDFDGKYILYKTNNSKRIVSKINDYKIIKKYESDTLVSLIPGSDKLLVYKDGEGYARYDLKTGKKQYIGNSKKHLWHRVFASGSKIVYSEFHTSIFRMIFTFFDRGELWYYDIWLFDLVTGKKERIYQQYGQSIDYIVIDLNEFPDFGSATNKSVLIKPVP